SSQTERSRRFCPDTGRYLKDDSQHAHGFNSVENQSRQFQHRLGAGATAGNHQLGRAHQSAAIPSPKTESDAQHEPSGKIARSKGKPIMKTDSTHPVSAKPDGRPGPRVFAPGGPRSAQRVHMVSPGAKVSSSSAAQAVKPALDDDLVLTPGGWRPKSRVHLLRP